MKKRFILDMTMLFVFLIVVGYKPLGNYWHETLGMVLFVLVFLHNYWNRQWYKSLKKGSWGLERKYTAAVDGLLIVSFLAVLLTAPFISRSYSLGFNIHFLEGIHKAGGALMLAAIGLHLANVSTVGIIVRLVVLAIVLGVIYFILPTGTRPNLNSSGVYIGMLGHLVDVIGIAAVSYFIQMHLRKLGRKAPAKPVR